MCNRWNHVYLLYKFNQDVPLTFYHTCNYKNPLNVAHDVRLLSTT